MKNLAGNDKCDHYIRDELERACIPAINVSRQDQNPDVKYSVEGRLGKFTFTRAWYYWIVDGPVPLKIAKKLYKNPVGKTDVRVAGHCGCPPPEHPWTECYDADGKKLAIDPSGKDRAQYKQFIKDGILKQSEFNKIHWVGNEEEMKKETAKAFVTSYHIDTEVGLKLFADAVRNLPESKGT